MADVAETGTGSGDNASFFRVKAGVVIAALLHAAALENKPMMWLLRAVNGERRVLGEAAEILDGSLAADSQIAASDLTGVLELDDRSRGAIFATTANAFAAYRLPGALASCDNPNFDPATFVAGDPKAYNPFRLSLAPPGSTPMDELNLRLGHQGRFDTIYITASSEQQSLVAPIVASFLSQIREATFARNRADEAIDYFTRPAVLWALDEIAGIAPMRDLPETLAQSGGQGLLIAACLQDLQMARAKWDKAADAFLTLFGNVVVLPGIRDDGTLKAISTVIGQHWVDVMSEGTQQSRGNGRSGWNNQSGTTSQITQQYVARLEPGAISQGRIAEHPHFVLGLTPSGWGWFFCTPYYCASPWPQLLVTTMEFAVRTGDPLERCWSLAAPILDKDHTGRDFAYAGGQEMAARYRTALKELRELGEAGARARATEIGRPETLLYGYDDTMPASAPAPVRSFIALQNDPGSTGGLGRLLGSRPEIRRAEPGEELLVNLDASLMTGHMPPSQDLSEDPFFHPEWVLEVGRHIAAIRIVDRGAGWVTRTTPMTRWASEIGGAGMLLEVWTTSRPAAYMARQLATHMSAYTPTYVLTNDRAEHFGSWGQPSTTAA